ncbi:hypothetical protein G6O67_001764 [Ophiocordyceps sinensis]|uniref:Pierisin-like domain-containing protein n=1 Tax=Ophiocordyceps sinensis TaxID=72228 RepID=A0A8H4V6K2_9HYPO|nr:hypothetical protein G6O67_001764 [Ophiocordyceps sinensis]
MRLQALLLAPLMGAYAAPASPVEPLARREKLDGRRDATPAEDAASKTVPDGSTVGVFFRGDSREPSEIFASGFAPQGSDMDLQRHLSLVGGSGYVSLSRSRPAASRYAHGRTGSLSETGHVYVVGPLDVPDGYWIPGVFSRDGAVRVNQEFAAGGAVPGSAVAGAYIFEYGNHVAPSRWIPNAGYAGRETASYSPLDDSCFKKFCSIVSGLANSWVCGGIPPRCAKEAKVCGLGQSDSECEDGERFKYTYHQVPGASRQRNGDVSLEMDRIYVQSLGPRQRGETPGTSTSTTGAPGAVGGDPWWLGIAMDRLRARLFEGLNCPIIVAALKLSIRRSRPKRWLPGQADFDAVRARHGADAPTRRSDCERAREMVVAASREADAETLPDAKEQVYHKSLESGSRKGKGGGSRPNSFVRYHDELA